MKHTFYWTTCIISIGTTVLSQVADFFECRSSNLEYIYINENIASVEIDLPFPLHNHQVLALHSLQYQQQYHILYPNLQ